MAIKKRKRVSLMQKKVALNLIDNSLKIKFRTTLDLLVDAGYTAKSAAANAKSIISSKGVIQALADMGFTESLAKATIANIMVNGREENKLRASENILKVVGAYAPDKHINVNMSYAKLVEQLNNEAKE